MTRWKVKAKKGIDRFSLTWSTRLIRFVAGLLPYRLGVWLGGLIGRAAYYLLPRDRKRALDHLKTVFSDKDWAWVKRTARRNFEHLGKAMLEVMLMTPARLKGMVRFQGLDNLMTASRQGRGVVFVTGHIGNWEMMGAAVAARFPLSVVAAPIEPEQVNDMIVGLRKAMGVRTILRGRSGASKELIRVFRENRVLGVLIDQDTDVEGAFVDFMGRPAWTPVAAAQMALKFNAAVVFGFIHRENDGSHTITIEGPLEIARSGNDRTDIVSNTAMFTKKIEQAIMKHPEQWVWMHRRWRRRP